MCNGIQLSVISISMSLTFKLIIKMSLIKTLTCFNVPCYVIKLDFLSPL